MRDGAKPAIAAIAFLTALPVGRRRVIGERDLRAGAVLFPLVGALVGALMAVVAWGAASILPSFPSAVLGVAAGVAVTGAMHLDGLADTADGVGAALGGRDPSVGMKDPRLGTFGGAALVLDLLLKTSVLAVLVVGGRFPGEAIAAAALGRGAALALAVTIPYAGAEDGAGAWLAGFDRRLCFAVLAIGSALAIIVMRLSFVPMLLVSLVVTVLVRWWSSRRLGGATGDVFGATSELTETLALVAAALAVR